MALLAQKIEDKRTGGFKGKSTFDSKRATCYRCGQIGHIALDYKVKSVEASQVEKVAERPNMYRQKYINLKKSESRYTPKREQKSLFSLLKTG